MKSLCAILGSDWGRDAWSEREGRSKGDAAGMEKKGARSKRGKAHGVATASSSVSALHAHKGEGDSEVLPLVTTEHGRSQGRCPMRDSFLLSPRPPALTLYSFGTITESLGCTLLTSQVWVSCLLFVPPHSCTEGTGLCPCLHSVL